MGTVKFGLRTPFVILLMCVGLLVLGYVMSMDHFPATFMLPTWNYTSTRSQFVENLQEEGEPGQISPGAQIDPKHCNCTVNVTRDCPPVKETVIVNKIEQWGPVLKQWWAQGKPWHQPSMFPRCTMDACFNFSRCENMEELLVYHYNLPSPPVRYFTGLDKSQWNTPDPEKACLFFVFSDLMEPHRPHPNTLPYWNNGLNHVIISFADFWFQRNPPPESIENASIAVSAQLGSIYRPMFDISIPLSGTHHFPMFQSLKPFDRKYLMTFKGSRYLGKGEGTLRSHKDFREMHNGKDIIVATTCRQGTNDIMRKERPWLGAHCDEDQELYEKYNYMDLMNTTFAVVPAGRSPASYRFIEVLSAGIIPVLVADNYVKPFDTLIQWQRCLIQFPSRELHHILPTIRALSKGDVVERQRYCLFVYHEFLKDDDTLLRSVIRSFKARFYGMFAGFSEILPQPPGKRLRFKL